MLLLLLLQGQILRPALLQPGLLTALYLAQPMLCWRQLGLG